VEEKILEEGQGEIQEIGYQEEIQEAKVLIGVKGQAQEEVHTIKDLIQEIEIRVEETDQAGGKVMVDLEVMIEIGQEAIVEIREVTAEIN